MKVLHFYKTSIPETVGGVQLFVDQLATGLARKGAEVDVLALSTHHASDAPIIRNGYRIHHALQDFEIASTGFSAGALPRFRRLAEQTDIIHYHYPWPFMDVAHLLFGANRPSVVTYHSDIVRQKIWGKLYGPLGRRFLASVDRIVATSPNYRRTSAVLADHADKVSVIPIGLDPASLPIPSSDRLQQWRARLGDGFFLFVGVLRYYKGLQFLIEAARRTGLPTVIVGTGPHERRLQEQGSGVRNITFLGYLGEEDKAAVLSLCGALVMPSHLRSEAFGIALLEGALHAKPLISTEIGTGTSFVNQANVTGVVVPPADPEALAQAMRHLHGRTAEAAAMGERARSRALALFGADQMTTAYLDLYRELLHRGEPTMAQKGP